MLLIDEISRRDSTASIRRADQAGLDPDMVLERWDKSAKVTYDRRVMNELSSLRFVICIVCGDRKVVRRFQIEPRATADELFSVKAGTSSPEAPLTTVEVRLWRKFRELRHLRP